MKQRIDSRIGPEPLGLLANGSEHRKDQVAVHQDQALLRDSRLWTGRYMRIGTCEIKRPEQLR